MGAPLEKDSQNIFRWNSVRSQFRLAAESKTVEKKWYSEKGKKKLP